MVYQQRWNKIGLLKEPMPVRSAQGTSQIGMLKELGPRGMDAGPRSTSD